MIDIDLTKTIHFQNKNDFKGFLKYFTENGISVKTITDFEKTKVLCSDGLNLLIVNEDFVNVNSDKCKEILKEHCLILVTRTNEKPLYFHDFRLVHDCIKLPLTSESELFFKIRNAFLRLADIIRIKNLEGMVYERTRELKDLSKIGIALSVEKDINKLLSLILSKAREITSSDAGSLYLVEKYRKKKRLRFKLTQNDTLDLKFSEFTMPITKDSLAGYTALTGEPLNIEDSYKISSEEPYQLNRKFDTENKYRTKSMLVTPLKNHKDEIIGVIQLINKKENRYIKLKSRKITEDNVVSYSKIDEESLLSLGSQAAVSIENNLLYKNIQDLFEGFVKAAITAIESRDPTTSGHSERVALLTVKLAETVNDLNYGRFKNVKFTNDQLKEIRYASLLHDFGKVGVREEVLLKAKKLFSKDFQIVNERFNHIKSIIINENLMEKLDYLRKKGKNDHEKKLKEFDRDLKIKLTEIEKYMNIITQANEPKILESESEDFVKKIAKRVFFDLDGSKKQFLEEKELSNLIIPKGSLNEEERLEIESHVYHSFQFLKRVPWTTELKNIPKIAYAHHEKLNGEGYPRCLTESKIPIQSRMMAIADIFDALTAWDRPYKNSVPYEKAINILKYEANDRHIDKDLVEIFIESGIYKLAFKTEHKKKSIRTY